MSGKTRVQGNAAITCDVAQCTKRYVAGWWGSTVIETRAHARQDGWTYCHARPPHPQAQSRPSMRGRINFRTLDVCPDHAPIPTHPQGCTCHAPVHPSPRNPT